MAPQLRAQRWIEGKLSLDFDFAMGVIADQGLRQSPVGPHRLDRCALNFDLRIGAGLYQPPSQQELL